MIRYGTAQNNHVTGMTLVTADVDILGNMNDVFCCLDLFLAGESNSVFQPAPASCMGAHATKPVYANGASQRGPAQKRSPLAPYDHTR